MNPPISFATALAALALVSSAHAASIVGVINFSSSLGGGIVLQDAGGIATTNLSAAKGVKTWSLAKADSASGSFMTIPSGQSITLSAAPRQFNSLTPLSALWSIPGPDNFTFSLNTSQIVFQSATFLAVSGTGILSGTGYTDTPAQWYFTTHSQPVNGMYVWSSSVVAVPETGTTTMLGAALCGLCLVRRRKTA